MLRTIPSGSCSILRAKPSFGGSGSGARAASAIEHMCSARSRQVSTSRRAWAMGFPIWTVRSCATFPAWALK